LGWFGRIGFGGRRRRVGRLAGGLEALEFVEGAIEGALDAGFVAADVGEDVGVHAEDVGQFLVLGHVDVLALDVLLVLIEAEFEEAGFNAAVAGDAPLGHDDLVDEGGFEGAVGLEIVEEGVEEFIEIPVLFADDDGGFGGEAVFEGIEASGGLAFGGFGASAALGILAIGGNLFIGRHGLLGLLRTEDSACWQALMMITGGVGVIRGGFW
jgi:hypothetical protein